LLTRADPRQSRSGRWILILILLTGFGLRLYRLADKEMWYDEAFAVVYAEKELASIVRGTVTPVEGAAADIHPLLYYFFLHGWLEVGQSPFVARFPSVVFGLLSLCLVYRIGRELFETRVGLLASVLTAVSPFHIWYSQEARMYSLLCLSSLLSIYFFVKAWQEDRWSYWMAFAFCSALSLYAHNLAFLVTFTLVVFVLATRRWDRLPRVLAACLVISLLFLPWLVLVPGQFAKVQQAYWVAKPGPSELVRTLIVFTVNLPVPDWLLPLALFYSLLLLTLTLYRTFRPSIRRTVHGPRWAMGFTLGLFFVPVLTMFVISQLKSVYIERAVLICALAYYIAVARTLLKPQLPRLVLLSLAPVPLLIAVSLGYQYTYSFFPRSPFRDANAYLREHVEPGDVIIHDNKLSFFPSHYYDRSLPQAYLGDAPGSPTDTLALPTQEVLGLLAQPDIGHATGEARRVWFVVFQRALDEARELGVENPSKAWLEARYHLSSSIRYNDLVIYLYESS
jgi:mannosyltransferase